MDEIVKGMKYTYEQILDMRCEIANFKKQKAEMKSDLWEDATGTVDQKKDYIKSQTADIDYNISELEAGIELAYNLIEVMNLELMYDE